MDEPRQWITGVFREAPRSGHIIRYNLIKDVVGWRRDREGNVRSPVPYNAMGYDPNSIVADPPCEDVESDNFRLNSDAHVFDLGFRRIPFDKIGMPDY